MSTTSRLTAAKILWSRFEKSLGYIATRKTVQDVWFQRCSMLPSSAFCIRDDQTAFEAVKRISKNNLACLVATNGMGRISGVISERDIIRKVALLNQDVTQVKINEIYTFATKLATVKPSDTIDQCLEKIGATSNDGYLPVVDDAADLVGIISVEDCLKEILESGYQLSSS